jgi:hypothetical protein
LLKRCLRGAAIVILGGALVGTAFVVALCGIVGAFLPATERARSDAREV